MPYAAPIDPLWPATIWDGESILTPPGAKWCALKVQPRCEKQVMQELQDQIAAGFLALATTSKIYQRRRIETQAPLFPGYVFAAGQDEQLSALWRLRHVSATLIPPDQAEFVRELSTVYRMMISGAPMTPEQQLQPGESARITRGSLKGLEGTVLRNDGGLRLIVGVTWLGQGVSVAVSTDMLERVWTDSAG